MKAAKLKKIGLAVLAVFGLYFAAYSSDTIAFKFFDKIDQALWPSTQVLGGMRHATGRFLDDWNPFFNKANIMSKLDLYEFKLSPKDIRYFFTPQTKDEKLTWVKPGQNFKKVFLRYRGQEYKASLKLHGDTSHHWKAKKKSLQVKLDKERYLNRTNRFFLILPELRQYLIPIFASRLAALLDLPAVNNSFVAVTMNDIFQGIYYMEERVDGKFLERKKISDGVLVQLSDNWVEDRALAGGSVEKYYGGISVNDHHDTPFNLEISDVKPIQSPYRQEILKKVSDLFEAIRDKDVASFESLLDERRVGAVDAWRTLLGDRHTLLGDNVRMVYEVPTGRFFFVPRSEGSHGDLVYDRGGFENWLNSKKRIVPFWEMLARSKKIRAVRDPWLYYFVTHQKEILGIYDDLRKQYAPWLAQDSTQPLNSRELRHGMAQHREILRGNLAKLKAQFEYHKLYTNAKVEGNRIELELVPDTSLQELQIDRLKLVYAQAKRPDGPFKIRLSEEKSGRPGQFVPMAEATIDADSDLSAFFTEKRFGFALDDALRPVPVHYRFQIEFENLYQVELEKLDIGVRSVIDGQSLPAEDIYSSIARATGDLSVLRRQSVEDFMKRYPFLEWQKEGNRLTLKPADYLLKENVIIPEGFHVVFPAGTQILLNRAVSLVSYSPLDILGTKEAPVIIKGSQEKPFGTFAVVGEDGWPVCAARWLEISNGSEAFLNGIYFSGALCYYRCDLEMEHSIVHHNKADDGLNVKYGKVLIQDSRFIENGADQIDLDFCKGSVRLSEFAGAQDDDNGDGLDISGSEMFVSGSVFKNFLDKGISVGEGSRMAAFQNKFENNAKAAAVKDMSKALFYQNVFLNNAEIIEAYQKKQIFGPGQIYFFENTIKGTPEAKRFPLDEKSALYEPTEQGINFILQWERRAGAASYEELFSDPNWKKARS